MSYEGHPTKLAKIDRCNSQDSFIWYVGMQVCTYEDRKAGRKVGMCRWVPWFVGMKKCDTKLLTGVTARK